MPTLGDLDVLQELSLPIAAITCLRLGYIGSTVYVWGTNIRTVTWDMFDPPLTPGDLPEAGVIGIRYELRYTTCEELCCISSINELLRQINTDLGVKLERP